MSRRDVKVAAATVSRFVKGCRIKGGLVFYEPVFDCLRGFAVESTQPGDFYVNVFFQPLFIPTRHLNLNAGFRLRDESGKQIWKTDSDALSADIEHSIKKDALPFLELMNAESNKRAIIEWAKQWNSSLYSEEVAACHAALGEVNVAESIWSSTLRLLRPNVGWQIEKGKRILELRHAFHIGVEAGNAKLLEWTNYTKTNLGILPEDQSER